MQRFDAFSDDHRGLSLASKSMGPPAANCTEYLYRSAFAPFIPEYFSPRIDSDGRVIHKYVYDSP